jgi:hypothetical protein
MGEVIAFPGAGHPEDIGVAVGQASVPEPAGLAAPEDLAVASVEFRGRDLASRDPEVLERLVEASSAVLAAAGARVDIRGTGSNPWIEARFEGPSALARASDAVSAAAENARGVSRGTLIASGAVSTGRSTRVAGGATFVTGSPSRISNSLRESAAPGQLLLAGASWRDVPGIEILPARGSGLDPRFEDVQVWVLRGLR